MADKPVTREEKYLAYLTGDYTGEIPKSITRKEKYLYKLCVDGIGTSKEAIAEAVQIYLSDKGVGLNMDADDKTEYECGFEVVDDNTLRLYPPIGQSKDFTFDLTDYVGRNFIFETYCNNPPITDIPTYLWGRMSILSVFCKAKNNKYLRDDFTNYADGQTLLVAPSGHVYTNFRNINAADGKYVNTNGANND